MNGQPMSPVSTMKFRDQKGPDMATRRHKKVRQLDEAARERVQAHIHLADALAWRQYHRCGRMVPLEELQGEAQLALAYAASLYDEGKGVPFGAYVTMVIRHRLIQAVTLWRRGGRLDHISFTDLLVQNSEDDAQVFEPVCPHSRAAAEEAAIQELVDRVRRVLPARWFLLLELYFVREYTLDEIAEQFHVSRERVRQLLAKAVARARLHCE
jgi:RNA polymerase sigma factor (sigma-70 family)